MANEVTMPQMGADMTEGTLVRWVKHVGDTVNRGDILAEVETDKATVELEAFEAGVLKKVVVEEGETVPVGEVIAILGAADEAVDVEPQRKPPAETPARRSQHPEQSATDAGPRTGEGEMPQPEQAAVKAPHAEIAPEGGQGAAAAPDTGGRVRISPVARRIASEAGLDVTSLHGTGPDGRILRRDVEEALRAAPTAAPAGAPPRPAAQPAAPQRAEAPAQPSAPRPAPAVGVQPLGKMRQAIARRMSQSKQAAPHYYLTLDIDMTDALAFRQQLNANASPEQKVSINDLIVKACALALERHPKFNSEFTDQGIRMHADINIDIGIALDEGLIAPAILNCAGKTLGRIAAEAKDLIERAKSGSLTADEYSRGTFTITNLGAYGVEALIGIINPPQAAILGVGSVMAAPAVRDGEVVVRQVMKVALSADHRVSDGAEGARFIKEIQGLLENPVALAL